jgi:hypothetical protein
MQLHTFGVMVLLFRYFYNDKTVISCEPICSMSFLPPMMPEAEIFFDMYSHTDFSGYGILMAVTIHIVAFRL